MELLTHLLAKIFLVFLIGYVLMVLLTFVGIILLDMIYPSWKKLRDSTGKKLFKIR
jgi:hypothetical protein